MAEDEKPEGWEEWMDNPLCIDQPEGAEIVEAPIYQMQIKQPYGQWMPYSNPRRDRDEVTSIQAFHHTKHPDEPGLRVLKGVLTWTVDEVPGDGDSQTPAAEIVTRNEQIMKRRQIPNTEQSGT